jgi:drug/metabolite transporter (DMT)-like permease
MIYVLIATAVLSMSASQLLLKKGLQLIGQSPHDLQSLLSFFASAVTNIYVIASVILTVITAVFWIIALNKTPLSLIYPFMALTYVIVAIFSLILLKEEVSLIRWAGIGTICIGVFLISQS